MSPTLNAEPQPESGGHAGPPLQRMSILDEKQYYDLMSIVQAQLISHEINHK